MYLEHFGFSDFPFLQSGKDELYYLTPPARKQIVRLHHWLDCGHDFLLVTGDAGSGRTALVQHALRSSRFTPATVTFSGLSLGDSDFLRYIALELGVAAPDADLMSLRHALKQHLRERADDQNRVCIIVQLAEQLPESQLNLLRDIASDEQFYLPLCSVVLIGDTRMGKECARLIRAEPGGRLQYQIAIAPLTLKMTADYLAYRLTLVSDSEQASEAVFGTEVVAEIHQQSGGNLAAINRLADHALMSACAGGKSTVAAGHVTEAVKLLGWTHRTKTSGKRARPSIQVRERSGAGTRRGQPLANTSNRSATETKAGQILASEASSSPVHQLLPEVTTIGRASDCTIRIDQQDISPYQALIVRTNEGMFIRNEGGEVPVLLNAAPVDAAALHVGDKLRIGDYELDLTTSEDGTPALVRAHPRSDDDLAGDDTPGDDVPGKL